MNHILCIYLIYKINCYTPNLVVEISLLLLLEFSVVIAHLTYVIVCVDVLLLSTAIRYRGYNLGT